jgi:thiamine biosynthesis lipoprotein
MGTTARVRIEAMAPGDRPGTEPPVDPAALAEGALDRIDEIDRAASLYKPDSDLVRVNASASAGPVRIGAPLLALVESSLLFARATGGAFDPTIKPLMDQLGFYREIGSRPDPHGLTGALRRVGWRRVEIDAARSTVRFSKAGMALDFGGIGKGFALDRAAAFLRESHVSRAVIELGRSYYFLGADPGSGDGRFALGLSIPGPDGSETGAAYVRVPEGSVATSSPLTQAEPYEGRRVGHIVDPLRGPLETDVRCVTIWAPEGAAADALATALVVKGPQGLGQFSGAGPFEALIVRAAPRGSGSPGGWEAIATPGFVWSRTPPSR